MMKTYFLKLKTALLVFSVVALIQSNLQAQTVAIVANPSQSGNITVGPNNYHVSENIYTDTEIGSSNFTTAGTAINHIDFNVFTVGSNTTITNYNLYLKEVPAGTETFAAGIYDITGYTLVFSGTYTPSVTGWVGVDLTTSFVRTSGSNLQLLIERLDNVPHASYSFRSTNGNNNSSTLLTSRRVNLATLPVPGTTVLNTASAFRPQIRLRHINPNDAVVSQVYTLGTLPIPYATPHVISANITNNGSLTLTNLDVTLAITGANTLNDVKTIASLLPDSSATVSFVAFTPSVAGNNSINVSVPADDFSADNSVTVSQEITVNAYNYAYGNTPTNSVGFNGNTGDIATKFTTNIPTSVNQVGVYFTTGGQPFKIAIWDKSGTGIPGALLWQSAEQVTTAGLFTLPVTPAVNVTDTFFVGVMQTGTTNIQFAYQNETPIRPNTFFRTTPTGSSTWLDFAPGNPFRFMIEPRLTIANDVGVSSITNPVSAKMVDNCGFVPKALVSNYGSNNQTTPFDVSFIIKQAGTVVYSDTKSISLNSGQSQEVSFAPFTSSVTGSDSSFCYTSLSGDGATNNDTVVNAFTTNNYSYGGGTAVNGNYQFANSTTCAAASSFQPTYNWVTETTNEINWGAGGDDDIPGTPISLPFTFRFFGVNYNQFWICSNGWISFTDPTSLNATAQKTPVSIPVAGGIENYIAALLTDLDVTPGTYADAHVYHGGDATQYIITFLHAHLKNSASYISFQIILKPDGNIFVQYNDAETTSPVPSSILNFCSAGIEGTSGTEGILYRLNGSFGPLFGSPLAVQFRPPATTPVTLLNFSAQRSYRSNKLIWATSQEFNSSYFIIERSKDGLNFLEIGKITAAGNSNSERSYSFNDNTPAVGLNYYRLRMVDIDNNIKYGPVKSVRNEGIADVTVYPNPFKNTVSLVITADKRTQGSITITDYSGRQLHSKQTLINEGSNTFTIPAASLAAGTYFVKVQLSDDVVIRKINKL